MRVVLGSVLRALVLLLGRRPRAALDELAALEQAPPLSDEELARQALEAGGDDGDSSTPE